MMDAKMIESYVEKIYGYAMKHTFSREEADELSQEILFTAVRELPKLRDENRFEPWLWGIANNVTKVFRRSMGKQRAMYFYNTLEDLYYVDGNEEDNEEEYRILRSKIAMLSSLYRDIIIYYYYDGLSVSQISEKLAIPKGTVTWRLSEARNKLKKEYLDMNETVLKPIKLNIGFHGEINGREDYSDYISDAISQNILYYCYHEAKTVEEISRLCGVPAYYIEDRLENLIKREAVSEPSKGKYRTEFIIFSDDVNIYTEKAEYIFEAVTDSFVTSMEQLSAETAKLNIYTAGKSENELIYLYGIMALEHLGKKYNPIPFVERPVRYNGGKWNYYAHLVSDQKYPVRGLGREASLNLGSRGSYQHYVYHFGGFSYREMMYDNQINICEDILTGKEITDKDSAALTIKDGFVIKKNDGELFVTAPAFTKEQKEAFNLLAESVFASSITSYVNAVKKYVEGYKKLFPSHLKNDIMRQCNYMFLTLYATCICQVAQKKGLLKAPAENSICDVLIQYK